MGEIERKGWKKHKTLLFVVGGFLLFFAGFWMLAKNENSYAANAPSIITYQGKLLYNGAAATTTQSMKFVLYDSLSGGTALYTASGTIGAPTAISVTPSSGLFSVDLGGTGTNSLDTTIFRDNGSIYLEVRVGSETLSPRKQLTASPYSINSRYLDGAGTATVSSSTYIPVSASDGSFTFNTTTINAGLTVDTNTLVVDRANDRVGIGTIAPNQQLEIAGNFQLPTTTATSGIIYSGGNRYLHTFGSTLNFFAGVNAGNLTTEATGNTGVGGLALENIGAGGSNTALGYSALRSVVSGVQNVAVGADALYNNTASNGTAVGFRALYSNTNGVQNTALGRAALILNTTGNNNVAVGDYALGYNTTGIYNVAIGAQAGNTSDLANVNVSGSNNIFIGYGSGPGIASTTPINNAIAIGYNALVTASNTMVLGGTGADAVKVGINTTTPATRLHVIDTAEQLRLGYNASNYTSLTIGSDGALTVSSTNNATTTITSGLIVDTNTLVVDRANDRVGIGTTTPNEQLEITGNFRLPVSTSTAGIIYSGANRYIHNYGTNNFFAGSNAGNFTMTGDGGNVGVGNGVLQSNTGGTNNVAIGQSALFKNTSGSSNMALAAFALYNNLTGSGNVALGYHSLYSNTGGERNLALGTLALFSNTTGERNVAIGYFAGYSNVTGFRNVFIGYNSGYYETGSDKLYIANTDTQIPLIYGDFAANMVGFGATNTAARVHIVSTTEQLRLGYDSSKFNSFIVGSDGSLVVSSTAPTTSANAFILNAANYASATNTYILSLRSNNSPVFSVSANGDTRIGGQLYAATTTIGAPGNPGDLAERVDIAPDDIAEPGDVLMVDPDGDDRYRRVNEPYSAKVAGVVSTNPTLMVGYGRTSYTAIMALVGRVPVKVVNENGAINRGDILVSASRPGYAMRYDPSKDDGPKMVGIIGVALEPLSGSEGKIMTLVRTGWANTRHQTILSMQENLNQLASAQGITLQSNPAALGVQSSGGSLTYEGGNLDMQGNVILNVARISNKDNKWMIDEEGRFVTRLATSRGVKEMYALQSPEVEFVFSSSSALISGQAKIEFDEVTKEIIDPDVPLKVNTTLTSNNINGIYVSEKSNAGFVVRELNNGISNATFDWIVVGRRRGNNNESAPVSNSGSLNSENLPPPGYSAAAPPLADDSQNVASPAVSASSSDQILNSSAETSSSALSTIDTGVIPPPAETEPAASPATSSPEL